MPRTQSLASRGSVSDGRDRSVNSCGEDAGPWERPFKGTLGMQAGRGWTLRWWGRGVAGKAATHFQGTSQVPRSGRRGGI